MVSDDLITQSRIRHLRILGSLWILYGILRLVIAVWLVLFASTATMMFGALLNRVPDPFTMMNDFHILYALVVLLSASCGILGVIAGVALLSGARFGRSLALIAAFLSLSSIPLGTTLGIYSLIVLLAWGPRRTIPDAPGVQAHNLKREPITM
jgi:hypothetical protein